MSTIINNPGEPVVNESSSDGWATAVIILLLVIAGLGIWYFRYYQAPTATPQTSTTNVQVTVPNPVDTQAQ